MHHITLHSIVHVMLSPESYMFLKELRTLIAMSLSPEPRL
jgi:hypothetical protein